MSARTRAAVVAAFALALVAGLTADEWNPCAGDRVCVLLPYTPTEAAP